MQFDLDIRRLAEAQHSLVARPQLSSLGLSPNEVDRLVTSGLWEIAGGRVLRLVGSRRSRAQRLLLPILDQGGNTALAYMACASWWGLRGCSDRPVTLATTGASRRTTDFAVVRRVRHLPPRWVVPLRGVPTLRPEYLAIHLFADCRFERAEVLVDRLWSMRLLSGPSIELALNDLGRSGRNGIVGARQYLERRPPGYIPTATGLEGRVQLLLEEHGITLRSQIDSGAEMWTGRVDFRHDTVPFVLEVQSEAFHSALTDVEHDERRHQRLVADGFTYREVWDTAVWAQPNVVVDTVRDGIAEALGAL